MRKDISEERKFLIYRLSYMRSQANLTAQDLSYMLGKSRAYIAKYENGDFDMPSEVLLQAIYLCEFTPEKFFCKSIEEYEFNQEVTTEIKRMSFENRKFALDILKKIK